MTGPRVTPEDIEAAIAREFYYNAVNEIWPLLGYQLREKLRNS